MDRPARCTPSGGPEPAWAAGMLRLGAGVYLDSAGTLHVSLRRLCEAIGIAPTSANQAIAGRTAAEVVRERFGDIPIEHVEIAS